MAPDVDYTPCVKLPDGSMRGLLCLSLLALCGCAPRIDTSSDGAYIKSLDKVQQGLSIEEADAFNRAYAALVKYTNYDPAYTEATVRFHDTPQADSISDLTRKNLRTMLSGKTAEEITRLGLSLQSEAYVREDLFRAEVSRLVVGR